MDGAHRADDGRRNDLQALAGLGFVLACFGSCFAVLALVLRFAGRRLPALAGLRWSPNNQMSPRRVTG